MLANFGLRLHRGIQLQRNLHKTFHAAANGTQHLKSLTKDDKRKFLDSFDMVFCDCDGVIWHTLRDIIPGSPEAIDYLRSIGKQVKFVTNNSITTTQQQVEKFQRFNMQVEQSDIVHPAASVSAYLKSIKFDGLIFSITASPFKQMLRSEGFQLVEEQHCLNTESLHDLREAIYNREPVKAIIIDVDFNLTAAKLMRAHVHLRNDPDCLLIGGAADALIPFGGGEIIGPGPFIELVEKSAKRQALVLGKPGKALSELLMKQFPTVVPTRTLFIGDSIATDVKFGKLCGFQTMLVMSGHTKHEDLADSELAEADRPDYIVDSLRDLQNLLK